MHDRQTHAYSVRDYAGMLADTGRTQAYAAALRKAVRPGCVVAEIGTGIGYFAMLACWLGARRVYAIEAADIVELAREIIARNDGMSAIQLIPTMSTELELPERADVVFSDLHNVLPLFEAAVPSIVHARERLLAPGGQLIPRRDVMWAAIVESSENYEPLVSTVARSELLCDLTPLRRMMVNSPFRVVLEERDFMAPPRIWTTLEYDTITSASARRELEFHIAREGTAHGIVLWFDSELDEEISLSNRPGSPEHIHGQAFFPFECPVTAVPGTRITIQLSATRMPSGYVWRWNTTAADTTGHSLTSFEQSTLWGEPIVPDKLRKRAQEFVPTLNDDGVIEHFALGLMDGNHSLRDIAERVHETFAHRFATVPQSLDWVSERSPRYSR